MKATEMQSLFEAYENVYAQEDVTQEFSEEVEIAAQYFYEMGLNEEGIDILIEELGVEEFSEWVYDIADDYYLTERKLNAGETALPARSRAKIGGKSAASRKFSDPTKKTTAGGKRRAARAAEREANDPQETPRQARIRELRTKAANQATKKQPKKPGLLDRMAGVVTRGIERHNAANKSLNKAASETGKTISNIAKRVGGVAREVGSGVSGTARLAGHVARKGLNDEYIMSYLIDEGYADTNQAALAIMANMSEEWRESIVEELEQLDEISSRLASNVLDARIARTGAASDRNNKYRTPATGRSVEDAAAKEFRTKQRVTRHAQWQAARKAAQ